MPVDTAVAQYGVRLHGPDPKSGRDALIAASAAVHRLKRVTRTVQDFRALGVELLDPGG